MISLRLDAHPDPALSLSPRDLTVITDALRIAGRNDKLADDALSLEVRINDWADNMGIPVEE